MGALGLGSTISRCLGGCARATHMTHARARTRMDAAVRACAHMGARTHART